MDYGGRDYPNHGRWFLCERSSISLQDGRVRNGSGGGRVDSLGCTTPLGPTAFAPELYGGSVCTTVSEVVHAMVGLR